MIFTRKQPAISHKLAITAITFFAITSCWTQTRAAAPPAPKPPVGPLAFPGAVGHGATSKGGRGGTIIAVTTLADSGAGSLRACIDATGPRTCVFRVAGVIRFTGPPPMIRNPYITIAGQTAPGGGITLAHSGGANGRTPLLIKNSHDVVVRHIRVRLDRIGYNPQSEDGFTIENSDNVILDHVSSSWARDEAVNGYGDNDRITISHSIFALGIPRHDKCALLASDPSDAQRLSFIGNLCAHNGDRNPDLNFPRGSCVEIVNNVLYNAQSQFAEIWESFGGTPVALIGNYFKAGHNTVRNAIGIARNQTGSKGAASVYMWDNRFEGNFVYVSPLIAAIATPQPKCALTVAAAPAPASYDKVLQISGAWPRDVIDTQVVAEVSSGTGRITDQPGVIPAIASGKAYPDLDKDGMDDRWEKSNRTKVGLFDPWQDGNGDGFTNLDNYLDARHRSVLSGVVP
ncbi:MAG: pectate lyase [Sphingorhabdus sp.]